MMEALHNRAVAMFICAAMIGLACLAGTGASLWRLRGQAESVFVLGPGGDGRGIQYDLGELAGQCYNITVIASRYLPESDARVSQVREKRDALLEAQSPKLKRRAAEEMLSAASVLRGALEAMELEAQDDTLLKICAEQINGVQRLIQSNGYNASAAYFNRILNSFPASLAGSVTGVTPLELYE